MEYSPSSYVQAILDDIPSSFDIYRGGSRFDADRAVRELRLRLFAGATVALTRAFTDTQINIYRDLSLPISPVKVWKARAGACPSCAALDGQEKSLDEEFDSSPPPAIHLNLLAPPRHIGCRCYLQLVLNEDDREYLDLLIKEPPGEYKSLSSNQIRSMPKAQLKAFTTFFRVTLERLNRIMQKVVNR